LVPGGGWTVTDLYDFGTNEPYDGQEVQSGVTIAKSGALYGVAYSGGTYGAGAVYKLIPPATSGGAWTETLAYSFGATTTDGKQPVGTILVGKSGVLYGVAFSGGSAGYGTIYQITPPASGVGWKETVIYNFTGTTDGEYPFAGVVTDGQNLYGTTSDSAYKLSPPTVTGGSWALTTLHAFTGLNHDGAYPRSPLLLFRGALFGTTAGGGITKNIPGGGGVVFELGK
jgi:uncharacterized repeat protein (TIGR03803 family)